MEPALDCFPTGCNTCCHAAPGGGCQLIDLLDESGALDGGATPRPDAPSPGRTDAGWSVDAVSHDVLTPEVVLAGPWDVPDDLLRPDAGHPALAVPDAAFTDAVTMTQGPGPALFEHPIEHPIEALA